VRKPVYRGYLVKSSGRVGVALMHYDSWLEPKPIPSYVVYEKSFRICVVSDIFSRA
jgi:hypothetical protein